MVKKASKTGPKEKKIVKGKPAPVKSAVASNKPQRKTAGKNRYTDDFPVVGIGASAGGLEAFEQFFNYMPPDTGMAFVLVSHLDPTHKSILSELIRSYTRMEVKEVEDGILVAPNTIYVIPPDCDMAIMHGKLHLMEPTAPRGLRQPIDFFFRSLSHDKKERAIAIVLSGTGTEGTLGLREVKGQGGMVMVQDPKTAKYNGMPRSAIGTGLVDYVLSPEKMPEQLIAYVRHPLTKGPGRAPGAEPESTNFLQKILIIIRTRTGHDFAFYKESTIIRRIERRMAVNEISNMADYVRYLQNYPDEVDTLFTELLIGVTNFFRDPEAFDVLKEKVMEPLVKSKEDGGQVRVWVPGCSTGEEAYSLAMLFEECKAGLKLDAKIQIFATDIDPRAIETARAGTYPHSIAVDVSIDRLKRFFTAEDNAYRVKKSMRDLIVFAVQNVVTDPPFSRLDIISCRNLLIYMGQKLQKKVLPLFHYSLNMDGFLFLGTSETIGEFSNLFGTIDRKTKVFQRKESEMASIVGAVEIPPLLFQGMPTGMEGPVIPRRGVIRSNKELAEKALLDTFSAAGVLIDEKGDILYFHGSTGKYLEPPIGEASLNVLTMAREGLKLELANSIRKSASEKQSVHYDRLRVKTNGDHVLVNLTVTPITEPPSKRGLLMVVFDEIKFEEQVQVEALVRGSGKEAGSARIKQLEHELASTREYLQTTTEELETTNEELKSTNEELQSANEELQSTNEELETAKEEQQSVNEELITVNSELQQKIDALSRANDDMKNLLASIQIGTIFLDTDLNIQRFTPAVTKIINLIDTDVGRPMRHIVDNLEYDRLIQDAQEVLNTLGSKEIEVSTKDGNSYLMRLLPYRTTQNVIEGVVITFIDITSRKKAEKQLLASEERYRRVGELIPFGVWISRAGGEVTYFSESFLDMLGMTMEESKGYGWAAKLHPDDRDKTLADWKRCVDTGAHWQYQYRMRDKHGNYRNIFSRGVPMMNDKGKVTSWAGINLDVSDETGLEGSKARP